MSILIDDRVPSNRIVYSQRGRGVSRVTCDSLGECICLCSLPAYRPKPRQSPTLHQTSLRRDDVYSLFTPTWDVKRLVTSRSLPTMAKSLPSLQGTGVEHPEASGPWFAPVMSTLQPVKLVCAL